MTVRATYSDGTDRDVTSLCRLPDEQRHLGRRQPRRPGHRRRPRRGVRHGPVRHLHRRLADDRPAQGPEVRVPRRARGQLRRHLRRRQAQEAPHRPLAPSAPTRSSSAASTSTSSACCPRSRSTTGSWPSTAPDKRAKLIDELLERKEFSEIWVNKWAELLQVKSSIQISYKAMFLYYNWLVEKLVQEHADGRDGPGAPRGQRRHVQEPGDELLPGDDRHAGTARRTWRRSSWACGSSAPSATTTRSTAGRRTTTTASPPSSRRSAASGARTIARRSSSTPAAARSSTRSAARS